MLTEAQKAMVEALKEDDSDPESLTLTELAEALGVTRGIAERRAHLRIASGEWQETHKRDKRGLSVKSYRPAKPPAP